MLNSFIYLLLVKINYIFCFSYDFELNNFLEEKFGVLDEALTEIDETEDIILSCDLNADIYTRKSIKSLFYTYNLNKNRDKENLKNYFIGWYILNTQKFFKINSTYLLIKHVTIKDSGIYYCLFKISYLSFISSILPKYLLNSLSKLWLGCYSAKRFECLVLYKFKIIVRKIQNTKKYNSLILPEEFEQNFLIIRNGKKVLKDQFLSYIALILALIIFILLIYYKIFIHEQNNSSNVIKERKKNILSIQKEILKDNKLEKDFQKNQENFRQTKTCFKDDNLIEKIDFNEKNNLKNKTEFEDKTKTKRIFPEEIQIKKNYLVSHLGNETEIKDYRNSSFLDTKKNDKNNKLNENNNFMNDFKNCLEIDVKGEIKLKKDNNFNSKNIPDKINLLENSFFKLKKKDESEKKNVLNSEKIIKPLDIKLIDNLKNYLEPKMDSNDISKKRKSFLKRRISKLTSIDLSSNKKKTENSIENNFDRNILDIQSLVKINNDNKSVFKSEGTFKLNPEFCDKPIQILLETPISFIKKKN